MSSIISRYIFPSLHRFSGPHPVGSHDLETENILIRFYYPTTKADTESRPTTGWLPRYIYGIGLGDFVRLNPAISYLLIAPYLLLWNSHTYSDASIAQLYTEKNASGARELSKLPVVIFSHGLAGFRGMYSYLLGDMASRGFLVISIEHRDGSACASTKFNSPPIWYNRPKGTNDELYIFRRKQIEERVNDIKTVISILRDFDNGVEVKNLLSKRSWWNGSGAFRQSDLRNRIDFENCVMAGHSFGAATAITALQDPELKFRCGILLDSWCFATKPTPKITTPLLSCNSESFHWPENLEQLRGFLSHGNSTFVTLKGTGHQDASDMPSLVPRVLLRYAGRMVSHNPDNALRLQSLVILEFLRQNLQMSSLEIPDHTTELRDLQESKQVVFGLHNVHFKGLL